MRRVVALALPLAGAVVLAVAAPAWSAPTVRLTSVPDGVARAVPAQAVHRLELGAPAGEERFTLVSALPVRISPPEALVEERASAVGGPYECEGRFRGPHADPGDGRLTYRYAVRIPAGGAVVAEQTVRLLAAPWPGESLRARFALEPAFPGAAPTIAVPQTIVAQRPAFRGRRGTRIGLTVGPHRLAAPQRRAEPQPVGRAVTVTGTTSPRAPRVELRVLGARPGPSRRVAMLRTARDGSFRVRIAAPGRTVELYAVVPADERRARDASSCGVVLPVG